MSDIKPALKTLIAESGKSLSRISRESGVDIWPLREWVTGRADKLDVVWADRLAKYLGKQGFSLDGREG